MLKMSPFSVDTGRQTTPPLVDGVVHNVHYRVLVQWTSLIAIASESPVLHNTLAPLLVRKFLN